MSSEFDASEFVDDDFQKARKSSGPGGSAANPFGPGGSAPGPDKAPSREEVEVKVGEMQQKLSELKRVQQELERERASLEEIRRRQLEFTTSRQEMIESLTRGVGLLEEAEFAARRDAEQMAKSLGELREGLSKLQAIREETWAKDNLNVELTRALTVVENARMEWNGARLKFPILNGAPATAEESAEETPLQKAMQQQDLKQLCKIGLAMTWPLALLGFLALVTFLVLLLYKIS